MTELSRRTFVAASARTMAALSTLSVLPGRVFGSNERVRVGTIGIRSQGISVTNAMLKTGKADIVALCDVDEKILNEKTSQITSRQNAKPKSYKDFRQLLDDNDIDAVVIGTPDHWHAIQAIEACKAGKDVYVEKPCAHNVHECRLIAQAARKYNRIVQHGTQQRSAAHFQEAKAYVQSGKLGKIAMSRTWAALGRDSIGKKPASQPPAHLDYDLWLGPAPKKPYTENRCHYNWRFMWDYGTGDMGNWGVHWLDIALWCLDLKWPNAVQSSGGMYIFDDDKETPDTQITLYEYPDVLVVWELRMWSPYPFDNRTTGTAFFGEEQTLIVNRGGWVVTSKDGKETIASGKPSDDMSLQHAHDFLDCVKSRNKPIAEIENGHISAAVAIMGNVAFLANEKIRYNPETDSLRNSANNHLLTRTYREPWQLPHV